LSDPRTTEKPITYIYGHPVMVVLDISVSMGAGHTDQTSFSNAVEAFNELTARKSDINFGLLLFSTKNYIARYFINKNELFKDTLENMGEIIQMSQGTQIAKALVKAQLFLADKIKGDDKTIILISDMDVASSDWKNIVDELTSISLAGMNTYIVGTGLGTQWAANIPQISGLKIMDVTGIDQICAEISAMQISPIREEEGLLKKSMIQFFILPALGVITLCLILGATRFRKIP
jgi:hypothetical protein